MHMRKSYNRIPFLSRQVSENSENEMNGAGEKVAPTGDFETLLDDVGLEFHVFGDDRHVETVLGHIHFLYFENLYDC